MWNYYKAGNQDIGFEDKEMDLTGILALYAWAYSYFRGPKTPNTFSTSRWYNISQRIVISQISELDGIYEAYIDGVSIAFYRDMMSYHEGVYLNLLMWSKFQDGGSADNVPDYSG